MKRPLSENREHPRKDIRLGILFQGAMEWFPADINDLAVGGLSFVTAEPYQPGASIVIFFGESKEIRTNELKVEVVRCEELESYSPPKYLVAAKLTDTNVKYLKDVLAYIKDKG